MEDGLTRRTRRADGYSILQRTDGRWEARVTVGYNDQGNPARKSFYGKTRAEVLELAQAFKRKLDNGGFAPITRDVTVGEWLDRWLEVYVTPRLEPKTIQFYEAFIRLHIKPSIGKIVLRKLAPGQVQHLLNEKSGAGLSSNFVRGLRATLRSALSQAWKEGLVEQNVASRVTPPKIEHKNPEFLEPAEAKAFLDAARGHLLEQLFTFALATGVRIGEASGLRWSDVDLKQDMVSISKQLQRINGKLVLKDLKSRSSKRSLPLSATALKALQEQRSGQLLSGFENLIGLVFLNGEGRPLDQKFVDKHLKTLLKNAGLRQMSFHKLRHTAATLMVAAGVDVHQVQQQLGHSQYSLTANLYAHRVTDAQRRAVDALDKVITRGELPDSP